MALTGLPGQHPAGPPPGRLLCVAGGSPALRPVLQEVGAASQLLVTEEPHRAITFGLFPGLAATRCL